MGGQVATPTRGTITATAASGKRCEMSGRNDGRFDLDLGDRVVSSRSPTPVTLAPGAIAYLTINKYRCDLGDKIIARQVRVSPPGGTRFVSVAFGPKVIGLNYCGPGDPGDKGYVSPVTATFRETLAH